MINRGQARGNGSQLASYLLTPADNDNIIVLDIRGTANPDDLRRSILEMSLTSELTKSDKGLYHAQINPAIGEDITMTPERWLRAAEILETELKLCGQKRAIVLHEKKSRIHAHVVWERYDHETGKMISDSYSRLAQDRARKIMEAEFQHQKTPDRNKKQPEMKKDLTALWHQYPEAAGFIEATKAKGYVVATGTQRPYIVVDETGRSFDLVRQLDGVRTREVRERFKETKLPKEKKAIVMAREAQRQKLEKAKEASKKVVPIKGNEAKNPVKQINQEVVGKAANDNHKPAPIPDNPNPTPAKTWTMSASFVQKPADQLAAQDKLVEVLTKEEEDKKKREKIVEEMKRRRELASKFRDNEQDMF